MCRRAAPACPGAAKEGLSMPGRPADLAASPAPIHAAPPVWRVAMVAGPALAVAAVLTVGQQDDAARAARLADPGLLAVLRLMAAIKAGAAIGLIWLAQWRLRLPAPRLASPRRCRYGRRRHGDGLW